MAFSLPGRLILRRLLLSGSWCSRMSTATDKILHHQPSKILENNNSSSSCSSPWLMLEPKLNNDKKDMSYSFYSLVDNLVLTPTPPMQGGLSMIHSNLRLCGSSHGWVALSNPDTLELFLYDPISHRHINLPDHPIDLKSKVILSSSPDDDESNLCRAIVKCSGLALCFPGRSKEWTPIIKTYDEMGDGYDYDDIVFSTRQNLLLFALCDNDLQTWDLSSCTPRMIETIKTSVDYNFDMYDIPPKYTMASQEKYLVLLPRPDDAQELLLLVTRYVMSNVAPDGSYVELYHCSGPSPTIYPNMTVDFSIRVYDQHLKTLLELEEEEESTCLGGSAIFIGSHSDSVVFSATRFPELKPNSIYFTDSRHENYNELFGGHDIGIFDFETRTVSPCYYPRDVHSLKRLAPSPAWFFPTDDDKQHVQRMMMISTSDDSLSKKSTVLENMISSINSSSPWLMLPPKFIDNDNNMNYNFYSLSQSKLITLPQTQINPFHDLRFRGSSHGWLALFNTQTFQLFLYDPISHHHINLPPPMSTAGGGVTKVTLTSSPDDDPNCLALMIYSYNGLDDAIAFCFPGRSSKEWTPLTTAANNSYKDFVYSPRQNLFYGLNKSYHLETWDLTRSTHHPRMIKTIKAPDNKYYNVDGRDFMSTSGKVEYLVVADDFFSQDRVLLVTRYLTDEEILDEDVEFVNYIPAPLDLYSPRTFGFDIHVYHDDHQEDLIKPLAEESLDDFTLFVGCHSDSVALPAAATRFPELRPNTIYYTDPMEPASQGSETQFWNEDFGIFNYKTKTLGYCFVPCDVERLRKVLPSKMWFFPRRGSGL